MKLPRLNLPEYELKIRVTDGHQEVWDSVRKKFVALLPEEWVRQNFIFFLSEHLGYSRALMKVETSIDYNQREKRPDILIYSSSGNPLVLVECKAPDIKISQSVFEQASVYNKKIKAPILVATNGLIHFCCKQNFETNRFEFLDSIPTYQELINS